MGRRKSDRIRTIYMVALGVLVISTQIICVSISLINSYWTAKMIGVVDLFQRVVESIPAPGGF